MASKLAERRLGPVGDYGIGAQGADNGTTLAEIEEDGGDRAEQERRLVAKFRRWFSDSYQASEEWRRDAITAREFVEGDQWTEEDRKVAEDKGRPLLTINKILAPVQFLEGVQRQQRRQPSLLPRETGDARASELMGALVKWVGSRSRPKEAEVDSRVFRDKIVVGMGAWKCCVIFENEPDGQIIWERIDPLALFLDPNWLGQGFDAMQYVMQADWLDLEQAMDTYPDHAEEIRRRFGEWVNGSGDAAAQGGNGSTFDSAGTANGELVGDQLSSRRNWWDSETQRIRCLEVWYARRVVVEVAVDRESGEAIGDEKLVSRLKRLSKVEPELAQQFAFTKRPVRYVRMAKLLDTILLEDIESPYDKPRFPFFFTLGHLYNKKPKGVVKDMIDPQREKNVRRSRIIEAVRRMPNSGFFNDKQRGAKTAEIEAFAAGDGVVINHEGVPPQQINPPELSQTLVYLEQRADQEIALVSNINAELQGQGTQRTVSGRAIEARQRGGLTTQEPLLESFQNDKLEAVEWVVGLIQQYVTPAKALRVLGSIAERSQLASGTPLIGDQAAELIRQSSLVELQELLQNAMLSEYDLEYTDVPWSPSEKFRRWETLADLVERFGEWLPPKVIAEAARDAGIFTEAQSAEVLAFIEKKLAMMGLGESQVPGQGPPQQGAQPPGAPPQQPHPMMPGMPPPGMGPPQ